jgi:hypothetical protein
MLSLGRARGRVLHQAILTAVLHRIVSSVASLPLPARAICSDRGLARRRRVVLQNGGDCVQRLVRRVDRVRVDGRRVEGCAGRPHVCWCWARLHVPMSLACLCCEVGCGKRPTFGESISCGVLSQRIRECGGFSLARIRLLTYTLSIVYQIAILGLGRLSCTKVLRARFLPARRRGIMFSYIVRFEESQIVEPTLFSKDDIVADVACV